MKLNSPTLPILTLKLVVMATFLEPSEKGAKSALYDQIPTIWWHLVKTGPADPKFFLLKKKKKELTQAEHITRGACMLHVVRAKRTENNSVQEL